MSYSFIFIKNYEIHKLPCISVNSIDEINNNNKCGRAVGPKFDPQLKHSSAKNDFTKFFNVLERPYRVLFVIF